MYILIIARGYPTEKYKMNGIFEFDQAKALVEAGHKVVYAAVDIRSIRRWRKWGVEYKEIEGIPIYAMNIPIGRLPLWIKSKFRLFGMSKLYEKILNEQGKPDLLHAHFYYMGYIASKFKQKINLPLVITEHFSGMMKPKIESKIYEVALEGYKGADAVIAVSPALSNIISDKFNIHAHYVPNIVDTKLFAPGQREKEEKFEFISIGRLIPLKRMELLLEAFYQAFKDHKKVILTIFGDGPEKKKLENLIKKYHLESRVKLMGLCSRNVIAKYLKKSDCFVLPSRFETFGVVYIEALASGVPVIATKCGGPEEFINEENGILVNADDINELSKAMIYMYENRGKYNKKRISREIKEKFSPQIIANQLIRIYNQIC
ncbi:glycosyltransferase [Garciella nitratireducens]|uniref:glycosyltransferase n=1 Tax=Garciella nitratireducens TaxID=218205 RepID=UPI001BD32532|nr:glycosyltransferase [Garciella nitratireducens]